MPTKPTKTLDTFPNPHPGNDYEIDIDCPEFTALCPMTGQPDFATIHINYKPGPRCVELKSLKLYIWSFRDEGHFHEDVTNRILNDLVTALDPREMTITGDFGVRGGIKTVVTARHRGAGSNGASDQNDAP
jgi:7-cyano-7-deazaguanine reductase